MPTLSPGEKVLNHVLDNILERGEGSTLKGALIADGFADIYFLFGISIEEINSLRDTSRERAAAVSQEDKLLLLTFIKYFWDWRRKGNSLDSLLGISKTEFDLFRNEHSLSEWEMDQFPEQATDEFHHIIDSVLVPRGLLKQALLEKGVLDVLDIIALDSSTIDGLCVKGDDGETILSEDKFRIHVLKDFYDYRLSMGDPLDEKWMTVTEKEFNTFRNRSIFLDTSMRLPRQLMRTKLLQGLSTKLRIIVPQARLLSKQTHWIDQLKQTHQHLKIRIIC